ncbi:aquaporin-like isoform X2 [Prorops nasuta]
MEQTIFSIISPSGSSPDKTKPAVENLPGTTTTTSNSFGYTCWRKLMEEKAGARQLILTGLAELLGTGILVFVGCMGCVGSLGITPSIMQICFAFGFAVMIAIQCFGHISGAHINPAITIASLIIGNTSLPRAICYIVAQCIGAPLGYGLLKLMTPKLLLHSGNPDRANSFCTTDVNSDLTIGQGFLAEVVATAILALFACSVWDRRNQYQNDSTSIRFAFCVSVLCFVFVPYTGCSLNPARSLAPALWNGYWTNHWLFWLGPITGAVLASIFYR